MAKYRTDCMKTSSVINGIKCGLTDLEFGGTMNHFLRKKV